MTGDHGYPRSRVSSSSTALAAAILVLVFLVSAIPPATRGYSAPTPLDVRSLVDDSQGAYPDSLDPHWGFAPQDGSVFNNVFQELVEYNGTNVNSVVPVLASSYSVSASGLNYTFQIRSGVNFTNGHPLVASDAWFSLVRVIYLNSADGIGVDNFRNITISPTPSYDKRGIPFGNAPWGLRQAVANAVGDPNVLTNATTFATATNNLLSNFVDSNSIIQKLISYPHQAYVVTGPTTFEVNLIHPYSSFLLDLASWWSAIVDPPFVDQNGGVHEYYPSTPFNGNGGPGTGPYEIKSVSAPYQVVLGANPKYWDSNLVVRAPNVEPPQIKTVLINYGLGASQIEKSFDNGTAQLASVPVSDFGALYNGYGFKGYNLSSILRDYGPTASFDFFGFNTQVSPTSNNDYRLALVHAINYSAILQDGYNSFNRTPYATEQFGPVPSSLPLAKSLNTTNYTYNIPLAAGYLKQAMIQLGYHLTMANGTVLGSPSTPQFPVQTFTYSNATIPASLLAEFRIISSGFAQLGIATNYMRSSCTYGCPPQQTPPYSLGAWVADWADPYYQLMLPAFTTLSGEPNFVDVTPINATLGREIQHLPYLTSSATQLAEAQLVYKFMKGYAPDAWMPVPDFTYFVQPYVKGLDVSPLYSFYGSIHYKLAPQCSTSSCSLNFTGVSVNVNGNVNASQFSNLSTSTNSSQDIFLMTFHITGASGSAANFTLTIPKTFAHSGLVPKVLVDGEIAAAQSYTQNSTDYFVTIGTHFSTHDIEVIFGPENITTTTSSSTTQPAASSFPTQYLVVGVVVVFGALGAVAFYASRRTRNRAGPRTTND